MTVNRPSSPGIVLTSIFALVLLAVPLAGRAPAAGPIDVRGNVHYGEAGGQPLLLDAYLPADGGTARPAVVLVHGGGWRVGGKADFTVEAIRFASEVGWVAFSVDYRLASASAFPAEVDDVTAAVRWIRAHAGDFGVNPDRIGALGASAGGHLVGMLATLHEGPLDAGARIRAAASWSGPMDLLRLAGPNELPSLTGNLLPCGPRLCPDRWDEASPIEHVDHTDAPLLLVNSTDELIPADQAREMAGRLQAAGVEHRLELLPGSRHAQGFGDDQWDPTVAFLRRHLEAPTTATTSPTAGGAAGGAASGGLQGSGRNVGAVIGVVAVGALAMAGVIVLQRRDRRGRRVMR